MQSLRGANKKAVSVLCALLLLVAVSGATTKHTKKSTTRSTSSSSKVSKSAKSKTSNNSKPRTAAKGKKTKHGKAVARKRGQQAIASDRTREIQEALIRAHYLNGEPSGVWDSETKEALMKLQGDNGWQTKIVPDSRALIKLGLGPSQEGLLNPDSAALSSPRELGIEREIPGGAIPHK